MIYDIRQTTTYLLCVARWRYARHVLRLTPIDRPASASMRPRSTSSRRRSRGAKASDFFGNRMTWIELDQPHDMLSVRVAARVAVEHDGAPAADTTPAVGGGPRAAFASRRSRRRIRPRITCSRAGRSRSIRKSAPMRAESFSPGRPVLDAAVDLMRRIKADFVYEIGATTASTTPPMSFALRRGVCQDFAHIMISGMRGLGLPAAYVSGYLRTVPLAGRGRGSRRRRHARLGAGVVRRGCGLVRARSRPTPFSPATTTSCSRSAATTPTSRRSTASSSRQAASGSKVAVSVTPVG